MKRALIISANVVIFWALIPAALLALGRQADRLPLLEGLPVGAAWVRGSGAALAAFGAYLCLHAGIVLRVRGKGLPISALPPTEYVTAGPYRRLRHPIYTGYTFMMAGLGLVIGSPGLALLVAPVLTALWLLTWVKLYEEPALLRRFGAAFRAHRDRTPIFFPLYLRRALRRLVLLVLRATLRLRVEGREQIPLRGPVVMVSDHLSYFDFVFAHIGSPRPLVIPTTAEVFRRRLSGAFIRLLGGVPKRRFCGDPAAARALADELLAEGMVGIAVEGERSWTGEQGRMPPGVALSVGLLAARCPVVPVAFVGSYRFWPRWAGGADRRAQVTVRVGQPFTLQEAIEGFVPGDAAQAAALERLLLTRIAALRDPAEPAADPRDYKAPRPELTLWRCPLCGAEERVRTEAGGRSLTCGACAARWQSGDGELTLTAPAERAGERQTLAGWAARAGGPPEDLASQTAPLIAPVTAELREEPRALAPLRRLRSRGRGEAELRRDRVVWRGAGAQAREIPLVAIRTVTTERNDTLQLGLGQEMVQLVFDSSSPLRWQRHLLALLAGLGHEESTQP